MKTMLEKLNRVYNKLQDDESRELFDLRLSYNLNRDTEAFFNTIGKRYDDWRVPQLQQKLQEWPTEDFIIVGSGYNARITRKLMENWGYPVRCLCEIKRELLVNASATQTDDVMLLHDAAQQYPSAMYIIGSVRHRKEMMEALRILDIPKKRILLPKNKYLIANHGKQYFDVFEPMENEVYIDAGTFDGGSVVSFRSWAGEKCKKIYAMEPMPAMHETIKENFQKHSIEDAVLLDYAAWNKEETLYFADSGAGSSARTSGTVAVKAIDIDSIVGDDRVTFIKMDIEGSELKALQGARETIIKNRPRLAICVYHKLDDIPTLGDYILDLVPEYKLYIRHYNSNKWETVLYAAP